MSRKDRGPSCHSTIRPFSSCLLLQLAVVLLEHLVVVPCSNFRKRETPKQNQKHEQFFGKLKEFEMKGTATEEYCAYFRRVFLQLCESHKVLSICAVSARLTITEISNDESSTSKSPQNDNTLFHLSSQVKRDERN